MSIAYIQSYLHIAIIDGNQIKQIELTNLWKIGTPDIWDPTMNSYRKKKGKESL